MAGVAVPFSDKSVAGVPISDESDRSDNSDESDAVMEHPIGCHSASPRSRLAEPKTGGS